MSFADGAARVTNTLLMENLDLEFLAEQGQVTETYLKAVLAEFGGVDKFRCFEFLGIACVQYSTPEQASAVSHSRLHSLQQSKLYSDTWPCSPRQRAPNSYSVHQHPSTSWPPKTTQLVAGGCDGPNPRHLFLADKERDNGEHGTCRRWQPWTRA